MNFKKSFEVEIIALIFHIVNTTAKQCCDPNESLNVDDINNIVMCGDGNVITIPCNVNLTLLKNSLTETCFDITDSEEELLTDERGYQVKYPFFCLGKVKEEEEEEEDDSNEVAVVCMSEAVTIDGNLRTEKVEQIIIQTLNCLSVISLAVTALFYGILRQVRDTHGICSFHFTLNMCLLHISVFCSSALFDFEIYYHFCLTHLYSYVCIYLSSAIWCSILSFNSWIHVKNQDVVDEKKYIVYYRYFGYGAPLIIVIICNIESHIEKLFSDFSFEMNCRMHQSMLLMTSTFLPMIISWLSNLFFFIDTQRRLWNYPPLGTDQRNVTLKKAKRRLVLNLKLFFIMGIPWLGLTFTTVSLFSFSYSKILNFCYNIFDVAFHSEGIFIFLIFVLLRKRVLKAIVNKWLLDCKIIPQNFRTTDNSEIDDTETGSDIFSVAVGIN